MGDAPTTTLTRPTRPATPRAVARVRQCVVLAAAAVFGVTGGGLFVPPVGAHAFLVTTSPPAGARLAEPPSEIGLRFSEPIDPASARVILRAADGRRVTTGGARVDAAGTAVTVPIPSMPDDINVVAWSVVADDGHSSAGEFAFAVGEMRGAIPGSRSSAPGVPVSETAATALVLVGLALSSGGLLSELLVWRAARSSAAPAPPRAPVAPGVAVALVGACIQLAVSVTHAGSVLDLGVWSTALRGRPGLLSAVEVATLAYALVLLRVPRLRPVALAPLTLAGVAAALRGHAGTTDTWWAGPANVAHLLLAALWVGALAHLVLVLVRVHPAHWGTTLTNATRRYATMALAVVPPLLVLGFVIALGQIDRVDDVVGTGYGRIMLVKLGLVAVTLGLAIAGRWRALPHARTSDRRRLGLLRHITGMEAVTLIGVVVASAVLVGTAPPAPSTAAAAVLGPPPIIGPAVRAAGFAGHLAVYATATGDALRIEVLAPSSRPPPRTSVDVEGVRPDGGTFSLFPRRCGPGCYTVETGWQPGSTRLDVGARAAHWAGGTATVAIQWPPGPDGAVDLAQSIAAMRARPTVEVTEQVTSGPGPIQPAGPVTLSGEEFMRRELYTGAAPTDIQIRRSEDGSARLTFSLPGSKMWQQLTIDPRHLLVGQLIINPGHRIKRSFAYPGSSAAVP